MVVIVNTLLLLNTQIKDHHEMLLSSHNNDPAQFCKVVVTSARVAQETATSLAGATERLTVVEGLTDGVSMLEQQLTD